MEPSRALELYLFGNLDPMKPRPHADDFHCEQQFGKNEELEKVNQEPSKVPQK